MFVGASERGAARSGPRATSPRCATEYGSEIMTRAPRILAGLAVAAITAAIALTPPASSDARDHAGHRPPDIGARHGHRAIR
jgi:hypothetical protein